MGVLVLVGRTLVSEVYRDDAGSTAVPKAVHGPDSGEDKSLGMVERFFHLPVAVMAC
jgi:hypothetical protein